MVTWITATADGAPGSALVAALCSPLAKVSMGTQPRQDGDADIDPKSVTVLLPNTTIETSYKTRMATATTRHSPSSSPILCSPNSEGG
jgi:hypothetical protein